MADIGVTASEINWSPVVQAAKWVLTVTGPGVTLREVVTDGGPLRLQAIAPDGQGLPDGDYNWELRSVVPSTPRGKGTESDPSTSTRSREWFERNINDQPMVTSGSFRVRSGTFGLTSKLDRAQTEGLEP